MVKLQFSRIFLLLFTGLLSILFTVTAMAIEEAKYRVVEQAGEFEMRVYDPKIIAEVEVSGTLKEASSAGFKLIADYIFGNNTSSSNFDSSEKISMTAPVTMQQKEQKKSKKINMTASVTMEQTGQKWRIYFVMPSEYTLVTLPKPNNPAVTIRQVQGAKYAVIRFSGFAGYAKVERMTVELEKWLKGKNIKAIGKPELARYNPPWTLPFMRRNEVMIKY